FALAVGVAVAAINAPHRMRPDVYQFAEREFVGAFAKPLVVSHDFVGERFGVEQGAAFEPDGPDVPDLYRPVSGVSYAKYVDHQRLRSRAGDPPTRLRAGPGGKCDAGVGSPECERDDAARSTSPTEGRFEDGASTAPPELPWATGRALGPRGSRS